MTKKRENKRRNFYSHLRRRKEIFIGMNDDGGKAALGFSSLELQTDAKRFGYTKMRKEEEEIKFS
jgi:hypothetical protein